MSTGSPDPTILCYTVLRSADMARKPTDTVQLKLRFPEALRRRLEREAKRNGRSLNSEILSILEGAFRQSDDVHQRAKAIAEALGEEIVGAIVEQAKRDEEADMQADYLMGLADDERIERERGEDK